MLKKISIIIISLILLLVTVVILSLNNEDISTKSTNKMITHQVIKNEIKNGNFILFVLSTGCEGCNIGSSIIKKEIQFCKANNIKFKIIFDELHNENTDKEIASYRKRNNFSEEAYIINPLEYKENTKIINQKGRLKDFLSKLMPSIDTIQLGYPQTFYFKDGKYKGSGFYNVEDNSLKFFK